jgi:hypothetical protein
MTGGSGGGSASGGGGNHDGGLGGGGGAGGGAAGGGSVMTVIDGGYATYDLTGGYTHEGHIIANQLSATEQLPPSLRIEFSDTAGSDATVAQHRQLLLQFPAAAGTYHCDGGMTPYVTFEDSWTPADGGDARNGQWNSIRKGTACTVTVSTLDAVDGGALLGTFSGTIGADTGIPVPDAGVVLMNGTFDVKF